MSSLVPQIGETLGELRMMLLCILAVLVDRWMNNRLEGVTDECVALQEGCACDARSTKNAK